MPGKQSKSFHSLVLISMGLYLFLLPFIQYPFTTILKPIPILLLIRLTSRSSLLWQSKGLLIAALGFSMLGDVVLTLPGEAALKAGIIAFLLTHCIYIGLYLQDSQFRIMRLIYFIPVLLLISLGYRYLIPYLGNMALPVTIYLCMLTLMVFTAFQVVQYPLPIIIGACLFLLSDFILALNYFIFDKTWADIAVMLSYYLAQFLLVTGLLKRKPYYSSQPQRNNATINPLDL
ncbi:MULTISPECIES: lysoplasmalogenase [unclassified Legionella]|uniref:lysoplasmalogenase n=1 Tax=unclassified Legionella TaxID=2622702 RepID=UPI0010545867|nr:MULTISPECIES: lysoplasmalogenase [unclassified Legionella]MDI9819635.1 lysoplasmalogenase [Legionella sp. PL877]